MTYRRLSNNINAFAEEEQALAVLVETSAGARGCGRCCSLLVMIKLPLLVSAFMCVVSAFNGYLSGSFCVTC